MIRIGIPRALLYYQYYPMWLTFFRELGAEVVISSPTNQAMLAAGSSRVVAETCLPVKVFLGHTLSLVKECDCIFIPAVRSVRRRIYNCAKFLGLPDMVRAVIPEAPPILDIDIDVNRWRLRLYQAIYKLGRHFSWNPFRVRRAALVAWQAHLDYRRLMCHQRLTSPQAIEGMFGGSEKEAKTSADHSLAASGTMAVIGHPYLLYDEYINYRLIHRLEQAQNRVLTPEMLTTEELESATVRLVGRAYWTYEEEVSGAGEHYLRNGAEGVVGVMAFGCGPDSLMMDMVRRRAQASGVPFLGLTLDEHTAEAGIVTRLEAFLDMLLYKKRGAWQYAGRNAPYG